VRVAILSTSYPEHEGDASGHFVEAEAKALARAGADVTVIAPGARGVVRRGTPTVVRLASGAAFGWPGALARLREQPLRALGVARFAQKARVELRERGPFERVIAHFVLPTAFPVAVGACGDAELEVVIHGSDLRLLARLPAPLRAVALGKLREGVASLRCVSRELLDELAALDAELAARARVEPCAFDLEGVPDRARARAELGLDERAVIVIVSRLVPQKRVAVALEAALLLPNARVVVIGSGPERDALARAFPSVDFEGQLPRRAALAWIAAADLVVSASEREGAPTVIREARALGTQVVSVRAGDLSTQAEQDPALFVLA
jgi:glycosyltransferase involved in cell wall biosynthesis